MVPDTSILVVWVKEMSKSQAKVDFRPPKVTSQAKNCIRKTGLSDSQNLLDSFSEKEKNHTGLPKKLMDFGTKGSIWRHNYRPECLISNYSYS
jgi:hypothetical protein